MHITVERVKKLSGTVHVPGDKSIAHRALILGALAEGVQEVRGLPEGADVGSTAACLAALGAQVEGRAPGPVRVTSGPWRDGAVLDAGNSGTTARLLSGVIAGLGLCAEIRGDASLSQRPMERVADPLRRMGAEVRTAAGGTLPLRFSGGALRGIEYAPPVASAQVKSAVLLAGLSAEGETTVIEKAPTRDHTENLLRFMGVALEREGLSVTVWGGAKLSAVHVSVPGDFSSAAFFLAGATILPGSEVRLPGVGLNPRRAAFLEVLREMGGHAEVRNERTQAGEPAGDLVVRAAPLHGVEVGGDRIPALIDELPLLAVLGAFAEGVTRVRDAEELRHKESDRIESMVENLRRMGARIEEAPDGFQVHGPCTLKGAEVSSFGDHRVAMALSVAGLAAEGRTTIQGSEAVRISFPGFFMALKDLARR